MTAEGEEHKSENLEHQVAAALGFMMMRFASHEVIVRFILEKQLEALDEDSARAVVSGLPFRRAREVLTAIVRVRDHEPEVLPELQTILRASAKLEERRNILTHSTWVYSDLPHSMAREKAYVSGSGVFKLDIEAFPHVDELEALVAEIDRVSNALIRWYRRTYIGLPTKPDDPVWREGLPE